MMSFPLKMSLQRRTFLSEAGTPARFDIITATLWNKSQTQTSEPSLVHIASQQGFFCASIAAMKATAELMLEILVKIHAE